MKKAFDYLIGIFIFLSAVFYIPGTTFNDSQNNLFKLGALILFAFALYFKPIRDIKNFWINSFLILAVISFWVVKQARGVAIQPLINITLMIMLYYVIVNNLKNLSVIYSAIMGVIIINFCMVLFQFFRLDPICLNDVGKQNLNLVGLFGYPMNMGAWTACVLPYILHKNKFLFILAFIILLASKSWAAIGVGIVGVLFYLFYTNKRVFKYSVITLVIACILGAGFCVVALSPARQGVILSKITLRIHTQYPMLRIIMSSPYIGYGMGSWPYVINQIKEIDRTIGFIDVTWNDYLGCATEMGFAALLIMLGLIRGAFRDFLKSDKLNKEFIAISASCLTIPLGAFFHSYMNYINIAVICMVMFCLYEIKVKENEL